MKNKLYKRITTKHYAYCSCVFCSGKPRKETKIRFNRYYRRLLNKEKNH